jgi:SAM-dependent methyltransferase
MNNYRYFYNVIDREHVYATCENMENHAAYRHIINFINKYQLHNKKCLEIGSGKGIYQNVVNDYTGLDIAESLNKYYKKPYYIINADGTYPFKDNFFDAIWSYEVHEHVVDLDQALLELKRVLKVGGVVFFAPSWQCRPWAAEGYAVRPYSDYGLRGKLIKMSIPIRNSLFWRASKIFPKRIVRHLLFLFGKRYINIPHKKLTPNWEQYWTSDSDACNYIEAHDAILWF